MTAEQEIYHKELQIATTLKAELPTSTRPPWMGPRPSPPSSSSSSTDGSVVREPYSSSESEDASRPNTLGTELLARLARSKKWSILYHRLFTLFSENYVSFVRAFTPVRHLGYFAIYNSFDLHNDWDIYDHNGSLILLSVYRHLQPV